MSKRTISRFQNLHVFHGTSKEGAEDIRRNGINIEKSEGGYFGKGFYTAEDRDLAQANYADFSFGDEGEVLEFVVKRNARILDPDNPDDFELWKRMSHLGKDVSYPDFPYRMQRLGIDGIYDRSFGGICFYNPNALKLV